MVLAVGVGTITCSEEKESACLPSIGFKLEDGTCAGPSTAEICAAEYCPDATLTCAQTYYVLAGAAAGGNGSQASPFALLADAAAKAVSGDCVLVGRGAYSTAQFSGGVNVLGVGPSSSSITPAAGSAWALAIKNGAGGVVRGFGLSGSSVGLVINGVKGLRVEQVVVSGATGVGLFASTATNLTLNQVTVRDTKNSKVGAGTSDSAMGLVLVGSSVAKLNRVLVSSNAQLGLLSSDSAVEISTSAFTSNGGTMNKTSSGVVISCSSLTSCKALAASKMSSVEMHNNFGASLIVAGCKADISKVKINGNKRAADIMRGIQVQGYFKYDGQGKVLESLGAQFTMADSTIANGEGQGVIIDFSTATLKNNKVSSNQGRGIWVQRTRSAVGQKVLLENNTVSDNQMVAIGGTDSQDVTIKGGTVSGTKLYPILVGGGVKKSGDGIQTLEGSSFTVEGVTVSKNERASIVVDGASTASTVTNCTIQKVGATDDGILGQNGATVNASGNKDSKGAALAVVNIPGTKHSLDPNPMLMPAAMSAPQIK